MEPAARGPSGCRQAVSAKGGDHVQDAMLPMETVPVFRIAFYLALKGVSNASIAVPGAHRL